MYDYLGPDLKVLKRDHVKIMADSSAENDFAASTTTLWKAIHNVPTNLWRLPSMRSAYHWMTLDTDRDPTDYHRFFVVRPDKDAERWTQEPSYTLELITKFMALVFISAVQQRDIAEPMAFAKKFMSSPSVRRVILDNSTIRYLSFANSPSTVFMMPNTMNLEVPEFITTHPILLDFGNGNPPPERQRLHVSAIGAVTIDGLYEMENGTKLLFQMTTAKKHPIADVELEKILACYRSRDSQVSLEDFVLVLVVPDEESKDQYLKDWALGKQVKIGQVPQLLRVGVMIINALQAKFSEKILLDHIHSQVDEVWPNSRKRWAITEDGKAIDIDPPPRELPAWLRVVESYSMPTSPSQFVNMTQNQQILVKSSFSSPKISPATTGATGPLKRVNATREGAEDAPGPSNAKRARLDADEVPAESLAPAAVPVMDDKGQRKGKGRARQFDE